jgi:putative transposase
LDELLVARVKELIHMYPTFGYRVVWAMVRFRKGVHVNAKAVYRVLKQKRRFVHQRIWTPRPRVQGRISIAERSNLRWPTDITHLPRGRDGWGHLTVVIDCHDREIIGYKFPTPPTRQGEYEPGRSSIRAPGQDSRFKPP